MALIDLTLNIEEGMLTAETFWHSKVRIEPLGTIEREGRNTHKISLGTHTGTHMDAPLHFMKDGTSIDKVNLDFFIQKALLIQLDHKEQDSVIDLQDLKAYDRLFDNIQAAVIRTGWSRKWMSRDYYKAWPYLTKKAAYYLVEKKIKLLGMDMPSPDSYLALEKEEDSSIHKIFLEREVIIVEYLTNLELINKDFFRLYAFPLRLKELDGSPARVIAEI